MNSDSMLFWLEELWMNITIPEEKKENKDTQYDIDDVAPWNKGRV